MKTLFPECQSIISNNSGAKADIHVNDGDFIKIGESGKTPLVLECRATPGHTNGEYNFENYDFWIIQQIDQGCMSFVWHGHEAVFTGDTLLIQGCGRTDFQQGNSDTLYKSVQTKLFTLPDHYTVYPAHDYTGI